MALDDLSAPLGSGSSRSRGARRGVVRPLAWAVLVLSIAALAAVYGRARNAPSLTEQVAVITRHAAPAKDDKKSEPAKDAAKRPEAAMRESAADVEAASGVKVMRPAGGAAPGSLVITVPGSRPTSAPDSKSPALPDRRLQEPVSHGNLPKIGADGLTPLQAYARPFVPPGDMLRKPRIAIVVTGLGIGASVTQDAISKLPPEMSLAFAPYGANIERDSARARSEGHEILLQVPMEPYDYPDTDPGPHTLRASGQDGDNLDRLAWLMSRFPGYIGIMNYLGGRFTASEAALRPIVGDAAKRGLMVLDDGSSARSHMVALAGSLGAPFARGDIRLDGDDRNDFDSMLRKLEEAATASGSAVGIAAALPINIEKLARWAGTAKDRGFVLAPVSALVQRPRR